MKSFYELYYQLQYSSNEKGELTALATYFRIASKSDILWMLSLFTGNRPKRVVSTTLLRNWAIQESNYPEWIFQESFEVSGDLCETVANLLSEPKQLTDYSLTRCAMDILNMKSANELEKRVFIVNTWKVLDKKQKFVFNKLISGSFRVGTSVRRLTLALSKYLNISSTSINIRLLSKWSPDTISFDDLFLSSSSIDKYSKPYPFHFAKKIFSWSEIPEEKEGWSAEWLWSGQRAQLIKRNGQIYLWSKNHELITNIFPEFTELETLDIDNFVIDGQIIVHNGEKSLSYSDLSKRMKRKSVSKKLMLEIPILFLCYDILEKEGKDIREQKAEQRKRSLLDLLDKIESPRVLCSSDDISFNSWAELQNHNSNSRRMGAKGIILKKKNSDYGQRNSSSNWLKISAPSFSIYAVLMYATGVGGGRSKKFSDFTFGVKKGEALVPFTKTISGLNESEKFELSTYIANNTIEKFGPVRAVDPKLVFCISFDNITVSARYKCGISVTNAMITSWEREYTLSDVCSLSELHGLLKEYDPIDL